LSGQSKTGSHIVGKCAVGHLQSLPTA
jgi:hypothetical protein